MKVSHSPPGLLWAAAIAASASAADWPHVGGDAGGTKQSWLDEIHRANVARLEVAWTFDTEDWSDGSSLPTRSAFEATPRFTKRFRGTDLSIWGSKTQSFVPVSASRAKSRLKGEGT